MDSFRKNWWRWLLWWAVDPSEWRAGGLFASRRIGALLAAEAGGVTAAVAALDLADDPGFAAVRILLLAAAVAWAALAGLLLRGHRAAAIGLMVLCTLELVPAAAMGLCWGWPGGRYDPISARALRAGLGLLLTWALLMHAYAIAARAARGGPDGR